MSLSKQQQQNMSDSSHHLTCIRSSLWCSDGGGARLIFAIQLATATTHRAKYWSDEEENLQNITHQ